MLKLKQSTYGLDVIVALSECVREECEKDCQKREYSSGQCQNFYGVDRCSCIGGHHNKDCQEYCREIGKMGGTEWFGKCICV
nr:unnamed protein product [Callosobruchus analis]